MALHMNHTCERRITFTIYLFLITDVITAETQELNVGTVLFSQKDLDTGRWSPTDIDLLRVRRYFQYVLPSPTLIDPSYDGFADNLLNYFNEALNLIKREDTDPLSTDILTAAISDAIGGYMKAYVIPIAKYGYYGGTVTKDDAQNIYQFYDNIKDFLKTDGSGWKDFEGYFQKPLKIIANMPLDTVRATRDYCAKLTFYEESPTGLTIALPSINFDIQPPVMYVPLKGNSLINLNAPSSSNALISYYQAAKKCLSDRSAEDARDFDKHFQTWLTGDVLTHLGDENSHLFYALGGVLTLSNISDSNIFEPHQYLPSIINTNKELKYHGESLKSVCNRPFIHINFGSKRIMIFAVILFLEIIWCIPALIYMICTRKANMKKDGNSSKLVFVVNPKKCCTNQFRSSSCNTSASSYSILTDSMTSCCPNNNKDKESQKYKMNKKSFTVQESHESQNPIFLDFESQTSNTLCVKASKATSDQTQCVSKQCSTDSFMMAHERLLRPIRSCMKNTSTQFIINEFSESLNKTGTPVTLQPSDHKSKSDFNDQSCELSTLVPFISDTAITIDTINVSNEKAKRQSYKDRIKIEIEPKSKIGKSKRSSNNDKIKRKSNNKLTDKTSAETVQQLEVSTPQQSNESSTFGDTKDRKDPTPARYDKIPMKKSDHKTQAHTSIEHLTNVKESHKHKRIIHKSKDGLNVHKSRKESNTMRRSQTHNDNLFKPKQSDYHKTNQEATNRTKSIDEHAAIMPQKSKEVIMSEKSSEEIEEQVRSHETDDIVAESICENDVKPTNNYVLDTSDRGVCNRIRISKSLQRSDYNVAFEDDSDSALIISKLDYNTKILQQNTSELMQLIESSNLSQRSICPSSCPSLSNISETDAELTQTCKSVKCQVSRDNVSKPNIGLQELRTCETMTLIADDDSSAKVYKSVKVGRPEISKPPTCVQRHASIQNSQSFKHEQSERTKYKTLNAIVGDESTSRNKMLCMKTPCIEYQGIAKELPCTPSPLTRRTRSKSFRTNSKSNKEDELSTNKEDKQNSNKEDIINLNKEDKEKDKTVSKSVKIEKPKPLFEEKIEKSYAAINVDITSGRYKKISKIPTRVNRDGSEIDSKKIVWSRRYADALTGSKIPQLVKKTLDDLVIRNSGTKSTEPDPRLNVTL